MATAAVSNKPILLEVISGCLQDIKESYNSISNQEVFGSTIVTVSLKPNAVCGLFPASK